MKAKWDFPVMKSRHEKTVVQPAQVSRGMEVEGAVETLREYIELVAKLKRLELKRSEMKESLIAVMGESKRVELEDMYATRYNVTKETIDTKGALEKYGRRGLGKLLRSSTYEVLKTGLLIIGGDSDDE